VARIATVVNSNPSYAPKYGLLRAPSGELVLVKGVSTTPATRAYTKAVVVTDRAVYKPGDTVHVKAYARSQQGTEMLVPTVGYTLRARWKGHSNPTADTAVRLDKATGHELQFLCQFFILMSCVHHHHQKKTQNGTCKAARVAT